MNINYIQQQRLSNTAALAGAEKIIYLDFDGVFGGIMLYNETEKFAKSVQYSARYAIEMLRYYGFEVNVITGDSSGTGNLITNTILERVPVNNIYAVSGKDKYKFIKERHDISKIFYAGDDLYDIAMSDMIFLTTSNAFAGLRNVADYVALSSSHDYFILELANAILEAFDIDTELFANKVKYDLGVSITTANSANKYPAYVLTESTTEFNTKYSQLLSTYYNVSETDLNTALFNVNGGNYSFVASTEKRTLILTSLQSLAVFCEHNAQPAGEIYLLLDDDLDLLNADTIAYINSINAAKYTNLSICTKHLDTAKMLEFYNYAVANKKHHILTILDTYYADIDTSAQR